MPKIVRDWTKASTTASTSAMTRPRLRRDRERDVSAASRHRRPAGIAASRRHRILEHGVDQHRDEKHGDEIQKQGGDHLIDGEAKPQPQRNKQQHHAGHRSRVRSSGIWTMPGSPPKESELAPATMMAPK